MVRRSAAEAPVMPNAPRKADHRAILLLVLALVPIAGALIGTLSYWRGEERELERLSNANDPVETSYRWFAMMDDYEEARLKLDRASWETASEADIAEASAAKQAALLSLNDAENDIIPLTARIAAQVGIEASAFTNMIRGVFATSRAGLAAQKPGAPILASYREASDQLLDPFVGRYVPAGESNDVTLQFQRELLYDLFGYHAAVRSPLVTTFDSLSTPSRSRALLTAVHGDTTEDVLLNDAWSRLRFNFTLTATGGDFALDRGLSGEEPSLQVLDRALAIEPDQPDSVEVDPRVFAGDVLALQEAIRSDVDLVYGLSTERVEEMASTVRDRQARASAIGALLAVLGLCLLGLTAVEIRHRRQVEHDHRDALARLDSKAQTDPLTGAGNRRRFDRVLQQQLDDQTAESSVVLAYVDLDRFKALNDVWGRTTGDQVLSIIARRLQQVDVGGEPTEVIRFGGDEFICFASVNNARQIDASEMGERLLAAVRDPIVVDGQRHLLTATAGVAISDGNSTADSLLLEADRSLMLGKRTQRGRTVTSDEATARSSRLVKILPAALERGEITCHYQPVFSIETGELLHVEALSRWQTQDGEMISPGTFVPLIEAFGMSSSLTRSVLKNISDMLSSADVPDHVGFWLNVAPMELEEFDFADRLLNDIAALNLPPERLAIEITETAAISDPIHFSGQVGRLAEVGIEIAIDDFGSGYSPLGYLQDLPVDVVKIDRSLISYIDSHESNQQLLKGIIGMLKLQGRSIVAEGVERVEELAWLNEHGVDMVQGYLTARPAHADDIDWQPLPAHSLL